MKLRYLCFFLVVGSLYSRTAAADLFVVNGNGGDTISRLDSTTGVMLDTFPTPAPTPGFPADGLAFSGTQLYYTNFFADTIFGLDPFTGAVASAFASPGSIDALAYGTTGLGPTLFALDPGGTIFLLNPTTGVVLSSFPTPLQLAGGMDFRGATGTLFVTDSTGFQAPRAYEFDPVTGALLGSIPLNFTSFGLGFDDDRLFVSQVSGPLAGSIVELDPETGSVLNAFAAPTTFPTGLAGGFLAGPVPEPATLGLLTVFLGAVLCSSRRNRMSPAFRRQ